MKKYYENNYDDVKKVEDTMKMWSWICVIFVVCVLSLAIAFICERTATKDDAVNQEEVVGIAEGK